MGGKIEMRLKTVNQFHFKGNVVAEPLLCAYRQVSAEHRLPLVYPNVESLIRGLEL